MKPKLRHPFGIPGLEILHAYIGDLRVKRYLLWALQRKNNESSCFGYFDSKMPIHFYAVVNCIVFL